MSVLSNKQVGPNASGLLHHTSTRAADETSSMLPTDPLTKTDIFQFDIVTRQLAANFFLVAFAATLVGLRFVARRLRETKVWYVNGDLKLFDEDAS
jgi:hypothetical protein